MNMMRKQLRSMLVVLLAVCILLGSSASLADELYQVSMRKIYRAANVHLGPDDVFLTKVNDKWIMMDDQAREMDSFVADDVWANEATPGKGFLVKAEVDGKGRMGLLWEDGKLRIPAIYSYIKCVDTHWAAGETGDGFDIYFEEKWLASFSKNSIDSLTLMKAYGNYLYIRRKPSGLICIDRYGNTREYADELYSMFDEYYYDWKTESFFHPGSGQKAFDRSCTLSAADVTKPYLAQGRFIFDLQGNIVGQKPDDAVFNAGRGSPFKQYIEITNEERKKGIADAAGNVVLSPKYTEIGSAEPNFLGLWTVKTDDEIQFVDSRDQVIQRIRYTGSTNDIDGWHSGSPFLVFDSMGDKVVFTASAGRIPQNFEGGYQFGSSRGFVMPFSIKGPDGYRYGLIDINGNILLVSANQIKLNDSGTMVHAANEENKWLLYRIETKKK